KEYGTDIIIGEEARRLAGDRICVRELDRLMVYGRSGGLTIYELVDVDDAAPVLPRWVTLYERALAAYRSQDFAGGILAFRQVLGGREADPRMRPMIAGCS